MPLAPIAGAASERTIYLYGGEKFSSHEEGPREGAEGLGWAWR